MYIYQGERKNSSIYCGSQVFSATFLFSLGLLLLFAESMSSLGDVTKQLGFTCEALGTEVATLLVDVN